MASRRSVEILLVLSYLPVLGVIPLLKRDAGTEVRWHARNGLLLFAAVLLLCVFAILLGLAVPALSILYSIVLFVLLVVYTVIVILAIVKALDGGRLIVPGVSRYARSR